MIHDGINNIERVSTFSTGFLGDRMKPSQENGEDRETLLYIL